MHVAYWRTAALAAALLFATALTAPAQAGPTIGDVFVIDMENHNLTQPQNVAGKIQQLAGNPAAPYLNSLMTPGNANAAQSSYASNYLNVLPNNAHIHPSEPNYIWQEGGSNFGILNDSSVATNAPKVAGATSLTGLMQTKGVSWKSYQEDTDLLTTGNVNGSGGSAGKANATNSNLTGTVAPQSQWSVPLVSFSGTSASYTNAYNGSHQYDFATKHDGSLFYDKTNGLTNGVVTDAGQAASNPLSNRYAPLQQLTNDLNNNTVARYNLITPNQFNDMHTGLSGGFTYKGTHFTGDQAAIAQGDNFLSIIVPQIMASAAYKNNGAIVIWFDETEADGVAGDNPDDGQHTLAEIVLSPLAKGNAFNSTLQYTHSSDLKTLEELFGLYVGDPQFIGDANTPGTNDLADLFLPGAIPEPGTMTLMLAGLGVVGLARRRRSVG